MKKNDLVNLSKISIILDSYDDIFSDFDPRHYSEKSFSDDFLNETKKVKSGKNSDNASLQLMMPEKLRDASNEELIINRMHSHFKKHYYLLKNEIRKMRLKGLFWLLIGFSISSAAAYISLININKIYLYHFIKVMLEPAGWFLCWNGLDQLFFGPSRKQSDLDFLDFMSSCEINFISYK